jgi:hypothetical protein
MSETNGVIMSRYDQLLKLMGLCDSTDDMEMTPSQRQMHNFRQRIDAVRDVRYVPHGTKFWVGGYRCMTNRILMELPDGSEIVYQWEGEI